LSGLLPILRTTAAELTGLAAELPGFPCLGRNILQRGRRPRECALQDFLQALVGFVGDALSWRAGRKPQ
jgi:hypothetical protein